VTPLGDPRIGDAFWIVFFAVIASAIAIDAWERLT